MSKTPFLPRHLIVYLTVLFSGCGGGSTTGTPVAALSPSSLAFGNQAMGSASAAQSVALANSGTAVLTILGISTSDPNFQQTNTCGMVLAAGAHCSISVTFTPLIVGNVNGALNISDNTSNSPQVLPLSGTGTTPSIGMCSGKGQSCTARPCCAGLRCTFQSPLQFACE